MKKIIIAIITVALLAGLAFKAKGLLEQRKEEIVKEPLPKKEKLHVTLTHAKEGEMEQKRPFLASVASQKSIKVSTKMAGYIEQMLVQESQKVQKGQLLAKIDERDINSNIELLKTTLAQQQNDLALAKQIYERNQKLYEVGGLAKEQVDTSLVIMQGKSSAIRATRQKIVQFQEQKSYLKIKAPFSGEIDTLLMHQGDLAVTGKPILTMSNGEKKLIFSFVPMQNSIKIGQKIYLDMQEIGEVKKILNLAKQGLAQAEVKLHKKLDLPLGSTLNIELLTQKEQGCIVPNNTLLHKSDGTYVVLYKDKKFQTKKVNILMSQNNQTLIKSCPSEALAQGSEVFLSKLGVYGEVELMD